MPNFDVLISAILFTYSQLFTKCQKGIKAENVQDSTSQNI